MSVFSTELSRNLALQIDARLRAHEDELKSMWKMDRPFRYFVLDNLLPDDFTSQIKENLPNRDSLLLRANLRERKRVGVDFRGQHPSLQAALYAFQEQPVLETISRITALAELQPDPSLYASGISVMAKGDFLNPHLDNSHDGEQRLYRSLNLLFYVSPNWRKEHGGNFELWDPQVKNQTEIVAKFNRLVVMETHDYSWHSVNKVLVDDLRCCVSNYYFSPSPTRGAHYKHVTTFTGRPEQKIRQLALKADGIARNVVGKTFPSLLKSTKHRLRVDYNQ